MLTCDFGTDTDAWDQGDTLHLAKTGLVELSIVPSGLMTQSEKAASGQQSHINFSLIKYYIIKINWTGLMIIVLILTTVVFQVRYLIRK